MSQEDIQIGSTVKCTATFKNEHGNVVALGTYTTLEFVFRKQDGTPWVQAGTMVGDGSTGQMTYTTSNTDIDQSGRWEHQGHVIFTDTSEYWSKVKSFPVKANLPKS